MSVRMSDDWLTVHVGDNRAVLPTLPERSVHTVVTSPPYCGLRDYGTATWEGGDPACDHAHDRTYGMRASTLGGGRESQRAGSVYRDCPARCGAVRVDLQLGMEPTPEEYVAAMVAVFREVRRVLRDDGTLWLNLGDSYAAANVSGPQGANGQRASRTFTARTTPKMGSGLKPKDLVGIPWRVAFALQADGWYLRSDIIWAKPNPMPESVTDRPTKSHEYLFLLAKSERYYFDADAVKEPLVSTPEQYERAGKSVRENHAYGEVGGRPLGAKSSATVPSGRNIRSVWTIATQPYPGAHFAVFPPKMVEPCILAGTSERGVCPDCGAPWVRVVERTGGREALNNTQAVATTGWRPTCAHAADPVPATVLDPFGGSGTTAMVAQSLSRRAVLIELNEDYVAQQLRRNASIPLGLM